MKVPSTLFRELSNRTERIKAVYKTHGLDKESIFEAAKSIRAKSSDDGDLIGVTIWVFIMIIVWFLAWFLLLIYGRYMTTTEVVVFVIIQLVSLFTFGVISVGLLLWIFLVVAPRKRAIAMLKMPASTAMSAEAMSTKYPPTDTIQFNSVDEFIDNLRNSRYDNIATSPVNMKSPEGNDAEALAKRFSVSPSW